MSTPSQILERIEYLHSIIKEIQQCMNNTPNDEEYWYFNHWFQCYCKEANQLFDKYDAAKK
jgi:hypothetical protein